jgi:ribosomal protein S27AE
MSVALHHAVTEISQRPSQRSPVGRRIRRVGLTIFFASIAVNAALGIYAVLSPDFGDTQGKILGTSLCATGAILIALACEPAWERGLLGPVPYAGALLGALGFGLAIGAIWAEPADDTYGKITGSTFTVAAACIVASLLALARLAPRHGWVFALTLALLAVGTTMLAVSFWLGDDPSEVYLRGMGVVLIALAAFVVSVPVLHWIDRGALAAAEATSDAVRFCPHCGSRLAGESGVALTCGRCGRGFTITPRAST